jgi:hypothetical protein
MESDAVLSCNGLSQLSRDTRVIVTLVARLLLSSAAQKFRRCEQSVFVHEHYFASKPSAEKYNIIAEGSPMLRRNISSPSSGTKSKTKIPAEGGSKLSEYKVNNWHV